MFGSWSSLGAGNARELVLGELVMLGAGNVGELVMLRAGNVGSW